MCMVATSTPWALPHTPRLHFWLTSHLKSIQDQLRGKFFPRNKLRNFTHSQSPYLLKFQYPLIIIKDWFDKIHSKHTCRASMNCLVPDLAMVPRLLTRSALVIPIPVSMTVNVLSSLLGMIVIFISFSDSNTDGSVRLWYRILSNACS